MSQNEETEAYSQPESVHSDIESGKEEEVDTAKPINGEGSSSFSSQQEPNAILKDFAPSMKVPDHEGGGLPLPPESVMKKHRLPMQQNTLSVDQESEQSFNDKIKETKAEIDRFRLEMGTHLELNRKLIRKAKDIDTCFNDVIAVAAGAEATLKRPQNAVQLQVVQKDIENMKKEIAIFRHQVQVESDKAARNSLDTEGDVEKELSKLQLELQGLETMYSDLVNKIEAKEKALLVLRKQIQSNLQLQLLEDIRRAEITLAKRGKRLERDRQVSEKNVQSLDAAERCTKLYDDLIRENYLDDD